MNKVVSQRRGFIFEESVLDDDHDMRSESDEDDRRSGTVGGGSS
jgi:hypothetical protein